jgi:predicted dehydrogenase
MINAAIVGLGWWGKTLVESLAEGSDVMRFTALATRTVSADVQAFAEQHKLRLLDSYEAALRDPKIDAVVLATPPSGHVNQIVAAAAAGKHVFCEKPFSYSKKDAESAVAAVRKASRTLGLGYNRRFHPEMTKLRERMRAGELGVIEHVECNMAHPNAFYFKPEAWRAMMNEAPVGGLASLGVHAVDAFIDLCGEYDRVYCQSFARAVGGGIDDTSSMLFRMKAGMSAYLSTITTTGPAFSIQVFGSKGWVRLEGVTHVAGASSEERRTRLFGACKYQPLKGPLETWEAEKLDVTRACFEAFARAAEGGPAFPITPEQMIHGASATEAIIRSAASGKVEKVL